MCAFVSDLPLRPPRTPPGHHRAGWSPCAAQRPSLFHTWCCVHSNPTLPTRPPALAPVPTHVCASTPALQTGPSAPFAQSPPPVCVNTRYLFLSDLPLLCIDLRIDLRHCCLLAKLYIRNKRSSSSSTDSRDSFLLIQGLQQVSISPFTSGFSAASTCCF